MTYLHSGIGRRDSKITIMGGEKSMKSKKGQMVGVMTAILISVLIGVIMTSIVHTQITEQTALTTVTNDPFTMSNTTCVRLTENCINSFTSVTNTTVTIGSGNYSRCTSSQTYDGILVSADTYIDGLNGQPLNASYLEESCAALPTGLTRTIAGYFAILMAVIILVYVAGWVR